MLWIILFAVLLAAAAFVIWLVWVIKKRSIIYYFNPHILGLILSAVVIVTLCVNLAEAVNLNAQQTVSDAVLAKVSSINWDDQAYLESIGFYSNNSNSNSKVIQ